MARTELLNNVQHADLKVKQEYGEAYQHNAMSIPVFPAEVRLAQGHYPLLFTRDEQGRYQMVALLGFEQNENLYLEQAEWPATYKPLMVEKGPFVIGRHPDNPDSLSVHIDLDDPRVSNSEGQPLFLPHGATTEYTDNIANVLSTLHESQSAHADFVSRCLALELIESFVLDIDMPQGTTHRLSGFYTVNEEKLAALTPSQLSDLHKDGHLHTLYMMLASLSNLSVLIRKKQARQA